LKSSIGFLEKDYGPPDATATKTFLAPAGRNLGFGLSVGPREMTIGFSPEGNRLSGVEWKAGSDRLGRGDARKTALLFFL